MQAASDKRKAKKGKKASPALEAASSSSLDRNAEAVEGGIKLLLTAGGSGSVTEEGKPPRRLAAHGSIAGGAVPVQTMQPQEQLVVFLLSIEQHCEGAFCSTFLQTG